MVRCSDNVFYAVNNGNFQISAVSFPYVNLLGSNLPTEGDPLLFTVGLSAAPSSNMRLTYSIEAVTAGASDIGAIGFTNGVSDNSDGTLTIPAGVSSFTISVETIDDIELESNETVRLNIGLQDNLATIADDEALSLASVDSVSNASAEEGEPVVFTVTLSSILTSDLIINYSFTNGTANSLSDYSTTITASSGVIVNNDGTLTLSSGLSSFTITVPTIEDDADETDETFALNVADRSGTGTIIDDDEVAVVTNSGGGGGGGGAASSMFFFLIYLLLVCFKRKVAARENG